MVVASGVGDDGVGDDGGGGDGGGGDGDDVTTMSGELLASAGLTCWKAERTVRLLEVADEGEAVRSSASLVSVLAGLTGDTSGLALEANRSNPG